MAVPLETGGTCLIWLSYATKREPVNKFTIERKPPSLGLSVDPNRDFLLFPKRKDLTPTNAPSHKIGSNQCQKRYYARPHQIGASNPSLFSTLDKVYHLHNYSHLRIGQDCWLYLNPWSPYYTGLETNQTIGLPASKNNWTGSTLR